MAKVRYIVRDVAQSVDFYVTKLGFKLEKQFIPAMAIVSHGDLTLWLAGPTASASRPMPDGALPAPGGWNRLVIKVDDLQAMLEVLREKDVTFRNNVVTGPGGKQILVEDPSGNLIELFEAA